jgi:hypothetical protein
MAIKSALLTSTLTAITDSLGTDSAIVNMLFCNLSSSIERIDVHIVKSGDSPGNINKILNQVPIDPQNTFSFGSDKLVISAGDIVYAATTTNNQVSTTISYVVM